MLRAFGLATIVLGLTLAAAGCSDDGDGNDATETGDPTAGDGDPGDGDPGDGDGDPIQLSHAADIQPIFTANCVDSCHEPGGLSSFMDLTDAYDVIVNVPAAQAGDFMRVEPGASDQSYIMAKLRGMPGDLGGQGARMPAGGAPPLDDATLDLIAAWIDGGALP